MNAFPKIRIKKPLTDDGLVTLSKKELEDLRDAYRQIFEENKNNPNVGDRVKSQWLGAAGVLSDICSLWAFPTLNKIKIK